MNFHELKNAVIEKSILIPDNPSNLFKKWTTSDGLKTFFGRDHKVELRLGGAYEIYFLLDAPEGTRGSEGCTILSFIPDEMLSFTWNAPPHLEARHSGIYTYVVINFDEVDDKNHTVLTLRHLGWPEDERYPIVYEYFDKAWDFVLENLLKSYSSN